MKDRVFSLSGVSGGSLGVLAWRLCVERPGADGCVKALGSRDLLTPLASAWVFEDALALVLPTGKCDLPGCGFVDRGSWFERSLERARLEYSQPLPLSPPYVFLNATWVETGERSIASNVQIETRRCVELRQQAVKTGRGHREDYDGCHPEFPTARDQLFEIGAVARASTLAHNSARFPYFNPIGYVRGQGHLADGGYFDNSGTQTTADILNEFVRQLTCEGEGCPLGEQQQTIADKVSFTAIVIRNGVRDNSDPAESNCAAPRPRPPQGILSNAAGPPITALNATGIGTPNRVSQCNLQRALLRLTGRLKQQESDGGYIDVRLVSGQTLYPLGWYLSPVAREGIETAAQSCVGPGHLADALLGTPYATSEDRSLRCFDWVL